MSEDLIVRHCSPTLAGMKTGSLFLCPFADQTAMRDSLRGWNALLGKKGIRVIPLRFRHGRALVYLFRPDQLSRDLLNDTACRLLRERGYGVDRPTCCVLRLIQRLSECEEFPHEIGLFLGYPPEDVCGFIENKVCKYVGCWKVYGDTESAQKLFDKYRKCTDVYCARLAKGSTLERLTVCKKPA